MIFLQTQHQNKPSFYRAYELHWETYLNLLYYGLLNFSLQDRTLNTWTLFVCLGLFWVFFGGGLEFKMHSEEYFHQC